MSQFNKPEERIAQLQAQVQSLNLENAELREQADELRKERERLEKGIRAMLDGDYPNPRQNRPKTCKHNIQYWDECGQCNDEYLASLLNQPLRQQSDIS